MNIFKVFRNPKNYLKALKFTLAGWYFDVFMKKFKAGGCSFDIPTSLTTRPGRGYFALDMYENVERQLVSRYIKGDEHVLELGACIGVVSCIVNARLSNPDKHVVVEANPELIPYLENNKLLNKSKFSIANCAISSKPEIAFYFGHSIVSGSLLNTNNDKQKTVVRGLSIDQLQENHNMKFDTLIMDIEGGEYDVLFDYQDKLKQFNLIIIENHPHLLDHTQISAYEDLLLKNRFFVDASIETSKVWVKNKGLVL